MLRISEIQRIEFKKVALGYSPDEVNDFLDKVIVDYDTLIKENIKFSNKITSLEEIIQHYSQLEETLKNSIILAEKTAEQTRANAKQSSEQIIRDAQLKATDILQDASKKLYKLEYDVMKMKNQYNSTRTKLRLFLETELEILEDCGKAEEEDTQD